LADLSKQADFWTATASAIPGIFARSKDSDYFLRPHAESVLADLSKQAEFRPAIAGAIPRIVALLKDSRHYIRSNAVSALADLSKQAKFQMAVAGAIPDIVKLLGDVCFPAQEQVVDLLVILASNDSLRHVMLQYDLENHCAFLVGAGDKTGFSAGVKLFATFALYGHFTGLRLRIILSAVCNYYLDEPSLPHGDTLIECLSNYDFLSESILEVAHILSFIINFVGDISSEQIRALILEMDRHGLMTTF